MRISKKEQQELAIAINSIIVARMMYDDACEEVRKGFGPGYIEAQERVSRWRKAEARGQVELAENYGIKLPGLEYCRSIVE